MDEARYAIGMIARGRATAGACENDRLEFKTEQSSDRDTFRDLAEAAVCFANAGGGVIVLGVADRAPGPGAFVGSTIDAMALRKQIHALTDPHLLVEVEEIAAENARLLMIRVPTGLDVHSTTRGAHTRRVGDSCVPMRPGEVASLAEERRGIDWSAQPSDRTIRDIDPKAEATMIGLLRTAGGSARERLAAASTSERLVEMSLSPDGEVLTNAADFLLCTPRDSSSPELLVYQHRATRGGEADLVRRWQAPMLLAFTEILDVVAARVTAAPLTTRSGLQFPLEDYPLVAVREAIANALMHGDSRYRFPVQIEHSPEALRIQSPGPLVAGITPQNILTHGSRPRFPLLARVMRTLGLAEELGQGVDRMYREMVRSGRSTPIVAVGGTEVPQTTVELTGGPPNIRLARFVAELPEAERGDTDTLLITLMLCTHRTVNASSVSGVVQRGASEAEAVLRRLAFGDAQIIEPTAGTAARRHPNYRFRGSSLATLGHAVTYARRSGSDALQKIVAHVREYRTINSATVQRIFDVDVYTARDILRDLVGKEILTRVSAQSRGTAVKYGPGPKFPAKKQTRRAKGLAAPSTDSGNGMLFGMDD